MHLTNPPWPCIKHSAPYRVEIKPLFCVFETQPFSNRHTAWSWNRLFIYLFIYWLCVLLFFLISLSVWSKRAGAHQEEKSRECAMIKAQHREQHANALLISHTSFSFTLFACRNFPLYCIVLSFYLFLPCFCFFVKLCYVFDLLEDTFTSEWRFSSFVLCRESATTSKGRTSSSTSSRESTACSGGRRRSGRYRVFSFKPTEKK